MDNAQNCDNYYDLFDDAIPGHTDDYVPATEFTKGTYPLLI
jgi:hypothetical protein